MKKKGVIVFFMSLVTFTQGASYWDIGVEEDREVKARRDILEYLTSGVSWAVVGEKDSAQVEVEGGIKTEPETFEKVTSTQVEGVVGDGNQNKEESANKEEEKKEVDSETFKQLCLLEARVLAERATGDVCNHGRVAQHYVIMAERGLKERGYVITERVMKKVKVSRTFTKKECEECKEMITTNAFFNHRRSHMAQRLCKEAGENRGAHTMYDYYKEARILLNRERTEKNSKKD